MSEAAMRRTIHEFYSAIRQKRPDVWADRFAEEGEVHDPVGTPPHRGRTALRRLLQDLCDAFQTIELTEDDVFICGNEAAVKWTVNGVGKTGRAVAFEGVDVLQVNAAGQIQAARSYYDAAAVAAQLQG